MLQVHVNLGSCGSLFRRFERLGGIKIPEHITMLSKASRKSLRKCLTSVYHYSS